MSDAEFSLVESFDIDDGQLDGLSSQECFVLGYELATIVRRAENEREEFKVTFHAENRKRVEQALEKRRRPCLVTWMASDLSEGWLILTVLARNTTSD